MASKKLSVEQEKGLLATLQARFEINPQRHPGIEWPEVQSRLLANPDKLWSLDQMESSDGEPDVIGYDPQSQELLFCDCSKESPSGRRSLCYDAEALEKRKQNKPRSSAVGEADSMGIVLLTEDQYRQLQESEEFDVKTSSWIHTPEAIRSQGGALFCDRRFNHVFTYHNGADSYYAARGFRALLRV